MEPSFEKTIKKIDLIVLLSSLLIFSFAVGLLYGNGEKDDSAEKIFEHAVPLLEVGDASQVAALVAGAPADQLMPVLKKILDSENTFFSRNNKIRLIFKLIRRIPNKEIQDQLLALLVNSEHLLKGEVPFLYLPARGKKTPETIPVYLEWAKNYPKKNPKAKTEILEALKSAGPKALSFAVAHNDMKSINNLINKGVVIDASTATNLLQQAVRANKNPDLVAFFKKYGADVNAEYPDKKGITPLIQAVDNRSHQIINALLDNGADINLIKDPIAGSALQHAVQLRDTSVDALLRKRGARE